jgi:hypothetical protein
MSKLKLKSLLEGYAWERNADGSLPTLKDAIATHAANVAEQAELNMPGLSDDETEVDETAKPDYIDLDGDGDETETMKKAAHDKEMQAEGEHAYKNSTNNELASHIGQLKSAMKDGKLSAKEIKLLQQDLEEMQAELKNRKQNEGLTERDLMLIAKFKKNLNESARRY